MSHDSRNSHRLRLARQLRQAFSMVTMPPCIVPDFSEDVTLRKRAAEPRRPLRKGSRRDEGSAAASAWPPPCRAVSRRQPKFRHASEIQLEGGQPEHGDFATNLALLLARAERKAPRQVARRWWRLWRRGGAVAQA